MRQILLIIIGILLVILAYFGAKSLISDKKRPKPKTEKLKKTVFIDTVKNSSVPIIIKANGNLVAKQRVELFAEVQGIFKTSSKPFKPGEKYNQGQVLVKIDQAEYYASVQSAKSNLYNLIAAMMPDIRLDYPNAFTKWDTYLKQFNLNKPTPKLPEFNSDRERYFVTNKNILTNYYNIKNLEERLSKYNIHAPFSGVLSQALVTKGTLIRPGQKLGEYINTNIYELEVAVSSAFSKLLKIGKPVQLNSLEGNQRFTGRISRVNSIVDKNTQTVTAFVDVKDKNLREGLFLEAQLEAKSIDNAYEIDRSLLINNKSIYYVKNAVLQLLEVNPVYFSDTKVTVTGIPENTTILSKPLLGAFSGMAVKIYNSEQ